MITFTKQTTAQDEAVIEDFAARLPAKGFPGDVIVYRNSVDTAIAIIALHAIPSTIDVGYAVGPDRTYIIIGTKSYEDGKVVREQVDKLREMVAPAFGVAPEAQKPPSPPAKPGKLNL